MFTTRSIPKLSLGLLLVSIVFITGCWGSKFTLITPDKAKVDRAYVGDFDAVNSKGDHAALVIRNIDDKLYYIETKDKDDSKPDRYVGFLADVRGTTFAHVRPMEDKGEIQEAWILMRISLSADKNKLTLDQLNEEFFKTKTIESAEQLRQVIEQNLTNAAMIAKDEQIVATRVAAK